MSRIRHRYLTRCTAIALFALLAGQFAVAGHAVVAGHGIADHCDICLSGDRLAHAVPQPPVTLDAPPGDAPQASAGTARCPVVEKNQRQARAPPIL